MSKNYLNIYNNFISSLVDYKYSIAVLPNDLQASYEYIRTIENEYSSIIPISHSSGCVNAINLANNFKNIEKAIFLDPVDNSKLFNVFNNIQNEKLFYLKDLLIITAEKSYKWSLDPFIVPFIPAFRLNMKKLLFVCIVLLTLSSCSAFKSGLTITANQTCLLGEFNDKNTLKLN